MSFDCKRCGAQYTQKNNLKYHLTSKNVCTATLNDIPRSELLKEINIDANTIKDFQCERCDKPFARKDLLKRHQEQHCAFRHAVVPDFAKDQIEKLKKENIEKDELITLLNQQNEKLKKENEKLKKRENRITKLKKVPLNKLEFENKDIINILSFSNTDYNLFYKENTIKKIKEGEFVFIDLVKEIFGNKQNMNIYIENIREAYAMVLDNNMKWNHERLENQIGTIHMNTCMLLQKLFCETNDDQLKSFISEEVSKCNKNYKTLFKHIRIALYAHKNKVTQNFIDVSMES